MENTGDGSSEQTLSFLGSIDVLGFWDDLVWAYDGQIGWTG